VALAGRREETLRAAASGVAASGAGGPGGERALVIPTDVRDPEAVRALIARVLQEWGRIDLLFNNAGLFGAPEAFEEFPLERWREVIDTNLTGCFLCAQEAFRAMKAQDPQGGRIINNGSISAHVPRPHAVAYTASKHAITGLTKTLSLEGRPFAIACGQIDIGNAATELSAGLGHGALQPDGSVLAEPMMDVEHAAEAVLYMARLPLTANVQFMTVMATTMPYVGRG
jgi:NAD(P)-dependent dehydrogenase (short-subunit alcohol dehydrogenase family)